jgi:hypothetical protein
MIDFLKECGLSDIDIQEIEEFNSSANLYNLNCNELDVIKMIDYLKEKGIKNILLLLKYKINIFFTDFEDFKLKVDNIDDKYIDLINNNYNEIDELFN